MQKRKKATPKRSHQVEAISDPHTAAAWTKLSKRPEATKLSKEQFLGLCAYIYALLRRGFQLHEDEIDSFILEYPAFEVQFAEWETAQLELRPSLPLSYHQYWRGMFPLASADSVAMAKDTIEEGDCVMTEKILREIWKEHEYYPICAEYCCKAIGQKPKPVV